VAGAGELRIDYKAQTLSVRRVAIKAGDVITTALSNYEYL